MPVAPFVVANDMTGSDMGQKINNAFATFGTGLSAKPGEVLVIDDPTGVTNLPITTPVTVGNRRVLRFGPGKFIQSEAGTITLTGPTAGKVTGAGRWVTELHNETIGTSAIPSIVMQGGASVGSLEVSEMLISRKTVEIDEVDRADPTLPATAVGIDASGPMNQCTIRGVACNYHYNGVKLGRTPYSLFKDSVISYNLIDGVLLTNNPADTVVDPGYQWWFDTVSSVQNGGSGFAVRAKLFNTLTSGSLTLGTFTNLCTFDNGSSGVAFLADDPAGGKTIRIDDIRILGGFFGADTGPEIFLRTNGAYHSIRDAFVEYSKSYGIEISENATGTVTNSNVSITGCIVMFNESHGIFTTAANTLISGCDVFNNGTAINPPLDRIGIYVSKGGAEITGNRSGTVPGTPVGMKQGYAVFCAGVPTTNVTVVGNRFDDNTKSPPVFGATINVDNLTS